MNVIISCCKCGKHVSHARIEHNPITNNLRVIAQCHGETEKFTTTHSQLAEGPSIFVFAEFKRVA